MKPRILHSEAMELSFKAKEAFSQGDINLALDYYCQAADIEGELADFYANRPDLEPTRSVIIRSAAFLNLKAGRISEAQKYIFFGLLNIQDELIREQLNNALELMITLKNNSPYTVATQFNYLNALRQKSIHYTLEPVSPEFERSVPIESVKDFFDHYLKSLLAFAKTQLRRLSDSINVVHDSLENELSKVVRPLLTNSGYGSFKFSIANDFVARDSENPTLTHLKREVVYKYHIEIFINPLDDDNIDKIKQEFSDEEINEIFRPLAKLKSTKSNYKVGYFDIENLNKSYVKSIVYKQRKRLITPKQISGEDIGELENIIKHRRIAPSGKVLSKTLFRENFKSFESDLTVSVIEPREFNPILLNESISVTMIFDSNIGFTLSFEDCGVEYTDTEFNLALKGFHNAFYNKILTLKEKTDLSISEAKEFRVIRELVSNIEALT